MIIDEAHRAVSSMYDGLFCRAEELCGEELFPECGLSATPGRAGLCGHEETRKLVGRFSCYLVKPDLGEEYQSNPLKYFREYGYLAKAKHICIDSDRKYVLTDNDLQDSETGEDYEFTPFFLKKLAADNKRNFKIIQELQKIPEDNPTLVYSCTVEQAHLIAMILTSLGRPE